MFKRSTPILASLDEAKTIVFYTEKLGFTFSDSHNGYLIFTRDGINVHLFPCDDKEACRNMGCYIYVTDIEQLYAEYQQLGLIHLNGPLRMMPWGLRQFAVVDNNGNIFYFADYKE
ncbi:bleomycin resistance protein [Mucilaginibacter endophyticus]|uniref:bleomycin resistance protein n=1 Tax=Mucilaginibacter endophyticus TaxID=2675003 RepID=UPI000E0DE8C4|nr:VOC family protein [Mucilaginibacter endophyticus]